MSLRALAEPPTLSAELERVEAFQWAMREIATAWIYPSDDGWSGAFVRDPVVRHWTGAMARGAYDGWSGRGLNEDGDHPDPSAQYEPWDLGPEPF